MPRHFRMEFILSNKDPDILKQNIQTFLRKLPATLSNLPQDVQGDLKYLCEEIVKRMQSLPYGSIPYGLSASVFLRILEGIVELDLKNLCELVMPAFFFIEGGISWITKMTERHGIPWCKTMYVPHNSNSSFYVLIDSLLESQTVFQTLWSSAPDAP
jgi:hypothetical protein